MLIALARHVDPRAALLAFLGGLVGLLLTIKPSWLLGEAGVALGMVLLCGAGRELIIASRSLLLFLVLVMAASWWEDDPVAVARWRCPCSPCELRRLYNSTALWPVIEFSQREEGRIVSPHLSFSPAHAIVGLG